MQWDLGFGGIGVLAVMSLVFGAFTQVVFWSMAGRWLWLAASAVFFAGGLFINEVWFGWATEVELQTNIDGLSFDGRCWATSSASRSCWWHATYWRGAIGTPRAERGAGTDMGPRWEC